MKRFSGVMILMLAVGLSGVAALETGFGFRGVFGPNWMSGDDWKAWEDYIEYDTGTSADSKARFAFGAGVFLDVKISNRLALGVEALYTEFGGKMEISDYKWTEEVTFHALQVPLTLKLAAMETQWSSLFLFAGPDLFFILDDVEIAYKQVGYDMPTYSVSPENEFVFGFVGGAGYERAMGSGALVFDVRYTRILGEVLDEEVYYNSFLVGLGFKFNLAK